MNGARGLRGDAVRTSTDRRRVLDDIYASSASRTVELGDHEPYSLLPAHDLLSRVEIHRGGQGLHDSCQSYIPARIT